VSSVEHGILAGAEGVRAMADAGTCWVPTLTPLHNLVAEGRWADLPAILERHSTAVSHGVELGMSILPGTDAGSPGVPHGSLPTELGLLAAAGLSGDALLAAATWRAADLLGLPRGYGRLAIGASTDLVWFERDPCRDTWRLGPPLGAVLAGRLAAGTELSSSV
jgi:imidazolonepropionase-like amidohydrolase